MYRRVIWRSASRRSMPLLALSLSTVASCLTGQNGAAWQLAMVDRLSANNGTDRREALRQMTLRYIEHMHSNEPVHSWPVG